VNEGQVLIKALLSSYYKMFATMSKSYVHGQHLRCESEVIRMSKKIISGVCVSPASAEALVVGK